MKNFKQLLIWGLVALLFASCGFGKMITRYPEVSVKLENPDLENKGGKVEYSVKGTVPAKYLKKKAVMEIEVPVLCQQDNLKAKTVINTIKLVGEKSKEQGTKISWKNGGSFNVSGSFDFNESYEDQEIYALPIAKLGKKSHTFTPINLGTGVSNTSSRIGFNPSMGESDMANSDNGTVLLFAPHEYKVEYITQTAKIYFEVNMSNMNWNLALNRDKASKQVITDFCDYLLQLLQEGRVIDKVVISGWASPEGEESLNQGLSQKRFEQGKKWFNDQFDKAVKNYAKKNKIKLKDISKPEIVFEDNARGEDWNGFEVAIEKSSIAERNKILNVVRSQTNNEQREQKIREMTDIYQEIADMILPPLRRVEIDLVCKKNLYSDEQILELINNDPAKLSLNERLYASTLTKDVAEKEKINTAIVNDPNLQNDWRAYNNLAILALNQYIEAGDENNLTVAKNNLDKAAAVSPNNGIILNNYAILYVLQGDKNAAKENFEKSASASVLPVKQDFNLGVFKIVEGDYTSAKSMMNNRSCEYSVALLQLLNKDYGAAKQTLECAPKDAKTYYLMAVLAARTQSEQDVYNYLDKAVSIDGTYKATAKKDAEFKKYKKSEQFKQIVQ